MFFLLSFRASIDRVYCWEMGQGTGVDPRLTKSSPRPTPAFPKPRRSVAEFYQLSVSRKRWLHLGLVRQRANEARLSPGAGESSTSGQDWFPGSRPRRFGLSKLQGEASGGNARTRLICNEFCPLALTEIFIAWASQQPIFPSYVGAKSEGDRFFHQMCN